jgi:hypothetical protein
MKTNKAIKMEFKGYNIEIPKGTRITHQTAMGIDTNYHFVSNLSWIPLVNGVKQFGLIHDATYYGININKKDVEL